MDFGSAWDFVKRHKGKIATATSVVGAVYATKKVLESDSVKPYLAEKPFSYLYGDFEGNSTEDSSRLLQSRKTFIFDCHQQSSDKEVIENAEEIVAIVNKRFDTESLVHRLRTEEGIKDNEKVNIWNQIKIKTFARIIALAYAHSLIMLALKTQKSLLCKEAIRNLEGSLKPKTGIFGYVKSFFYEPAVGSPQIFTDPKAQQVFLHCIQYLTINGLGALFDRIEVLTERRLANISLAKEFNASSLAILMEKIKYDVESSAGQSNFSELVVPVARPINATSFAYNSGHLEELLSQLTDSLQTSKARSLLSSFVQKYIYESTEYLDTNVETIKSLPLAKLLPVLSDSFSQISLTQYDSVLQRNLTDPDLYQHCQTVCHY